MTAVAGEWDCVAETPLGEQRFLLTVRPNGTGFAGSISGAIGSAEIADGSIQGERLRWAMDIRMPMPMRLICEADVQGDRIEGGITAGGFGTFPLSGTRKKGAD